ncbi:efflux RND transporter periplasmic adaptor subunit [Oligoflexus tunisiensis]|uniref:efflux RND transporter periplasmic adaptor subunit n=1 Tax=Oligoflexus tunisiensis TaxID=708132 RepID=UPI00114D3057|nr:efflux RND transporter periplasmic adaptor subunit [Oligoflexus tunisiensis]
MRSIHLISMKHYLVLFMIAAACSGSCKRNAENGATPEEPTPMLVGPENTIIVRREAISSGPRLSGSLEPREQARVRAEISGSVTSVEVDMGRTVTRGQILARIEDTALRNAYASAQSALRSAEFELQNAARQAERTQALVQGGALAPRDLEVAQSARTTASARVAQARAQLAQAREQLEAATVRSPMDGAISEKAVNQGDVVTVGALLFTVIDPSSMRLEASVPSDALPILKIGTPVAFAVRGYPDQIFTGTIEQIAPAADPATRQIPILIAIPNPGGQLIAGLFAEGRISAETRETLVVPVSAIENINENPSVMRIRDGRTEQVPVKIGLRDPQTERVEIQGDINEGDVLLTGAAKSIAPGAPVRLTGANAS